MKSKNFIFPIQIRKVQQCTKAATGVPIRTIQRIKGESKSSPDGRLSTQGKKHCHKAKKTAVQFWTSIIYVSFKIQSMNFM